MPRPERPSPLKILRAKDFTQQLESQGGEHLFGEPALAMYLRGEDGVFLPFTLQAFTVSGGAFSLWMTEWLTEALEAYEGALIVASHDVPFLESIGITRWLLLEEGELKEITPEAVGISS